MKNKIKNIFKILVVTAGCLMFASFSPSLDGRAVVVDKGVFPQGLFAKTVGYLPGDIISVTNIAGDNTIDLLVIGALDPSEGVAIMLSPEAADAMGIDKGANNIVKITKRSGQDERVYGNAVISKSAAAIDDLDDESFENISAEENSEAFDEAEAEIEEAPVEEAEPEEEDAEVADETEAEAEPAVEEEAEEAAEETPVEEEAEDEEAYEEEAFDEEEAPVEETEAVDEEADEEEFADETPEEFEEEAFDDEAAPAEEAPVEEETPEEEGFDEEAYDAETPDELPAEEEAEEPEEEAPAEEEAPEEEGFDEEAYDAETPDQLPAEEEAEEPEEEAPAEEAFEADELESLPVEAEEPAPVEEETEEAPEESESDEYEAIVLVPVDSNPPESDSDEVEDVISETDIDEINEEITLAPVSESINASVSNVTPVTPAETKPAGVATSYDKYLVPSLKDLESGKYYIQIAAYGSDENILEVINKYGNNYPITIVPMAGGKTKQVLIGPVSMDEYKVVLERFKSYGFKDAFLRKVK